MATSSVSVTPGDGTKKLATYSFSEDAVTKEISRVTISDSAGAEISFAATGPVSLESSSIYNGATALTPKWAVISCSSSGDNEIVALVSAKKLRVLSFMVSPSAAVNAKWQSSTAGDKTGLMYMSAAGNGHACGFNPAGWFETAAGESLQLNLSGAVAVGGVVQYIEV
jgi:hypothetical protein